MQQAGLITFHRQQVVRLFVDDQPGNRLLAAHGVDTDQKALEVQRLQQFRASRDLIALARHLLLTKQQAEFGRERTDHVNGLLAASTRTAHRFAFDRNRPAQRRDRLADQAAETALKSFWIKLLEDAKERVFRGDAVLEHHEAPQPALVCTRPFDDIFHRVTIREHSSDRHHQNFQKVMPRPVARLARVFQPGQNVHQNHAFLHLLHRPKDESRPDFRWVYKMRS